MMIVRAHDDDGVSAEAGTHGEGSASRGVQHASGCAVAKEECKHLMVQGGRLKRRERERGKESNRIDPSGSDYLLQAIQHNDWNRNHYFKSI